MKFFLRLTILCATIASSIILVKCERRYACYGPSRPFFVPEHFGNLSKDEQCCVCCNGNRFEYQSIAGMFHFDVYCDCWLTKYCGQSENLNRSPYKLINISPQLNECLNPTGDDCDWYLQCLHEFNPCDQDGDSANEYAVSYGHKYCTRYQKHLNEFSSKARVWIGKVKKCLQDELKGVLSQGIACEAIRNIAFESHSDCYVDNGLCDLSIKDWNKIRKITGDAFFSGDAKWKTLANAGETGFRCSEYFLKTAVDKGVRVGKKHMNDVKEWFTKDPKCAYQFNGEWPFGHGYWICDEDHLTV